MMNNSIEIIKYIFLFLFILLVVIFIAYAIYLAVTKKKSKVNFLFLTGISACFLIVIFVSFVLPEVLIKEYEINFEKFGVYGDLFGCFNSLMSALAFGGLIYTIMLQRKDLELQRQDYNQTREEIKKQAVAQTNQSELMRSQLNESVKIKKADYLHDIIEKLMFDSDIVSFIDLVDYREKKWYDENFHKNHTTEKLADKTLTYLSYVLYLKKEDIICDKEFHFVEYILKRTLTNDQVHSYLYNLYHFDRPNFLYQNLLDYAKEKGWLKSNFYDKNAGKRREYPVYLNNNT